ncbi:MAG: patatin-like phospholipase family protein [Arenicellales bacterium]|nr:patatin-like phospholipase family protein [Arenicellales bacterium]
MNDEWSAKPVNVGIALGGGGAKGLAHISMLEVLDELGIRPSMIAGTSIGAIVGVIYASGISAKDIRNRIDELTIVPKSLKDAFEAKQLFGWLDYIGLDIGRNSLLNVDKFLDHLEANVGISTFEELKIPLKVVASDFWARQEVVFDSGPITPAVAASFALPGIFKPVVIDDRVLVDGGSVNPLPYDLLQDTCDIVIAVNVMGQREPKSGSLLPSYSETIFNTFQIAEQSILNQKFKVRPPTIYIEPEIEGVKVLEFHKAEYIHQQAIPAQKQLKKELSKLLQP